MRRGPLSSVNVVLVMAYASLVSLTFSNGVMLGCRIEDLLAKQKFLMLYQKWVLVQH